MKDITETLTVYFVRNPSFITKRTTQRQSNKT